MTSGLAGSSSAVDTSDKLKASGHNLPPRSHPFEAFTVWANGHLIVLRLRAARVVGRWRITASMQSSHLWRL